MSDCNCCDISECCDKLPETLAENESMFQEREAHLALFDEIGVEFEITDKGVTWSWRHKTARAQNEAEIKRLRTALEFISHGYGQGCSADDYGEVARKALNPDNQIK